MAYATKMLTIAILSFCLVEGVALADKAIVNIDFDLNNIAITEEAKTEFKGQGLGILMKGACTSNSEEGLLPLDSDRGEFPYKEILQYYDRIEEETVAGRTVNIEYNILNYQVNEDIFSNEYKGYSLFGITWSRLRLNFKFKKKNGEWASGFCLPTTFSFQQPSSATIIGYGDVPVLLPGLSQEIHPKAKTFQEFRVSKNYTIWVNRYPIKKSLFLALSEQDINDERIRGQKIQLTGKATLGDSTLKTEWGPFYYPFDKYSTVLMYKSYFPSSVSLNFVDIEDLDMTTPRKKEFITKAGEDKEIPLSLFRKNIRRKLALPIVAALFPLLLEIFQTARRRWWVRLLVYIFVFVIGYFGLPPPPLNVSKLNILNLGASILFLAVIFIIEYLAVRMRIREKRCQRQEPA
jgi:hypothetical protein